MATNKEHLILPTPLAPKKGNYEEHVNKEEVPSEVKRDDGFYPVSKADRIRERQFRNRVHGTNKKYLKPYLKG